MVQAPASALVVCVAAMTMGACAAALRPAADSVAPHHRVEDRQPVRPELPTPLDGQWTVDERGRQYRLARLPKSAAVRIDDKTIRNAWGMPLELLHEDASYYYYKYFKLPDHAVPDSQAPTQNDSVIAGGRSPTRALESPRSTGGLPPHPARAWSVARADDAERVAASYHPEAPPSDRLRFLPFAEGLPTIGQWRDGFAVGDMNLDGHPDIIHGASGLGTRLPTIFLGDGKGHWRAWEEALFPPLAYDFGDVQVGDLNGDGLPDLVLGIHGRGLVALLGNGRGKFTSAGRGLDYAGRTDSAEAGTFASRALALVDWNADGRLDILALGEGPRLRPDLTAEGNAPEGEHARGVALYLNRGKSGWLRRERGTGSGIFGESLSLGDFNADGQRDFATGSGSLGRSDIVNLGRPDGTWDPMQVDAVRPSGYVRAVEAGDFDRDGHTDLALGYVSFELGQWRSGVDLLYARPPYVWQRRVLAVEEGRRGVLALATGDLDGDGQLDLVALTGMGATWIFPGDGRGFLTRETSSIPDTTSGCRGAHLELDDLDHDGRDELIVSFAQVRSIVDPEHVCPTGGAITAWKVTPHRGGN